MVQKLAPFIMPPEELAWELARLKPANDNAPGDTALLVIDVQKEFCYPGGRRGTQETDKVAGRIASIVPEFRAAGIPVYAVYWTQRPKQGPHTAGFYRFLPEPKDIFFGKTSNSAFADGSLSVTLRQKGHSNLLVCGFNLAACVQDTVLDGNRLGFKTFLLSDLTGDDRFCNYVEREVSLRKMYYKGAVIADSQNVLQTISNLKTPELRR